MKSLALISAMLLMTVASFGREHVSETATIVADTIYYAADQTSVTNASQAAYYRLLLTQGKGVAKRDLFTDYYMDGTLKAEGGYSFIDLGNDNNTVLDGNVTTYYVNGKEKLNGKYVNGKREGYFTLNLRDGGIAVIMYKNGKSKFDYFMVTHPDGTQEKLPLSNISSLLQ
ncbi:MAG: toxin-antitoxin system YwqK family antitoxin [Prevotella sp.]|jgi:antitoxin component YwqK of YwqJK toxin-antitoxin module